VCDQGACGCQTVGDAGGWYTADIAGGSVSVALTGMVLVDGPLPVGDAAALVTVAGIGVLLIVANNQELIQSYANSIGGTVTTAVDASGVWKLQQDLVDAFQHFFASSSECEECVNDCIVSSGNNGAGYNRTAGWCKQYTCNSVCK
jgi:hypothetical protein